MDFVWAGTLARPKTAYLTLANIQFSKRLFCLGGNGITFSVIGMELVSEMLKKQKTSFIEYLNLEVISRHQYFHKTAKKCPSSSLFLGHFIKLLILLLIVGIVSFLMSAINAWINSDFFLDGFWFSNVKFVGMRPNHKPFFFIAGFDFLSKTHHATECKTFHCSICIFH
jgi:hypothetical protein